MGNCFGSKSKEKPVDNGLMTRRRSDNKHGCSIAPVIGVIRPNTTVQEFYTELTNHGTSILCDINYRMVNNWTLLLYACEKQNIPIVKALLEAGADVNACLNEYQTPLNLALMHHNFELFKLLAEHGGITFLGLSNYLETSGEEMVSQSKDLPLVLKNIQQIKDYSLTNNMNDLGVPRGVSLRFINAFKNNEAEQVKALLERHRVRADGLSSVRVAVEKGWFPMVKVLVEHGAAIVEDYYQLSNVELARHNRHEEIALYLEETQQRRYDCIKKHAENPKKLYLFHFGFFSDPTSNLAFFRQCTDLAWEIEKKAWEVAAL